MNSPITTHILDTSKGRPAQQVDVSLELETDAGWQSVGNGRTNDDGRVTDLMSSPLEAGNYRITFDVGAYYARLDEPSFYPSVSIVFRVEATDEHYHVPLLLNPFGFSTYRGS